ncbi:MAG: tryptophan-rich sensory protein [Flavobacteriia bacterium]|nr:tryptophan-rich sensory protein [Flavobacteriia bacterium]
MKKWAYFLLFLFLNFAALALGGLFTKAGVASDWYQDLNKAPWTPPGWVFGAAWTFLMVCYSVFLAFLFQNTENRVKFWANYALQWIFNVAWNPLFFKLHLTQLALVDLLALFLIILITFRNAQLMVIWKKLFLLPYALWLVIAISLNSFIVLMN